MVIAAPLPRSAIVAVVAIVVSIATPAAIMIAVTIPITVTIAVVMPVAAVMVIIIVIAGQGESAEGQRHCYCECCHPESLHKSSYRVTGPWKALSPGPLSLPVPVHRNVMQEKTRFDVLSFAELIYFLKLKLTLNAGIGTATIGC